MEEVEAKQHVRCSRTNAQASYAAFFDDLKEQVRKDVEKYNQLFGSLGDCRAYFEDIPDGFSVTRLNGMVMIAKKSSGTVITMQYFARPDSPPKHKSLEVAPDEHGNIGYKQNGHFWRDAARASQSVLEEKGFLCG